MPGTCSVRLILTGLPYSSSTPRYTLVDAYLVHNGLRALSHQERINFVARLGDLKPIGADYLRLENRSRYVRDRLIPVTVDEIESLAANELAAIEARIGQLLDRTI